MDLFLLLGIMTLLGTHAPKPRAAEGTLRGQQGKPGVSALILALDGRRTSSSANCIRHRTILTLRRRISESGCRLGYPQSSTTKECVSEVTRELDQEEVHDEAVCLEV